MLERKQVKAKVEQQQLAKEAKQLAEERQRLEAEKLQLAEAKRKAEEAQKRKLEVERKQQLAKEAKRLEEERKQLEAEKLQLAEAKRKAAEERKKQEKITALRYALVVDKKQDAEAEPGHYDMGFIRSNFYHFFEYNGHSYATTRRKVPWHAVTDLARRTKGYPVIIDNYEENFVTIQVPLFLGRILILLD